MVIDDLRINLPAGSAETGGQGLLPSAFQTFKG
jgi:hypothetical protein